MSVSQKHQWCLTRFRMKRCFSRSSGRRGTPVSHRLPYCLFTSPPHLTYFGTGGRRTLYLALSIRSTPNARANSETSEPSRLVPIVLGSSSGLCRLQVVYVGSCPACFDRTYSKTLQHQKYIFPPIASVSRRICEDGLNKARGRSVKRRKAG